MSIEARLAEIDLAALSAGRSYFPSPSAWEDEVLYFLMLDRFSDGREHGYRGNDGSEVPQGPGATTPPFGEADAGNAVLSEADAARWREAGVGWCGGTLKGLV